MSWPILSSRLLKRAGPGSFSAVHGNSGGMGANSNFPCQPVVTRAGAIEGPGTASRLGGMGATSSASTNLAARCGAVADASTTFPAVALEAGRENCNTCGIGCGRAVRWFCMAGKGCGIGATPRSSATGLPVGAAAWKKTIHSANCRCRKYRVAAEPRPDRPCFLMSTAVAPMAIVAPKRSGAAARRAAQGLPAEGTPARQAPRAPVLATLLLALPRRWVPTPVSAGTAASVAVPEQAVVRRAAPEAVMEGASRRKATGEPLAAAEWTAGRRPARATGRTGSRSYLAPSGLPAADRERSPRAIAASTSDERRNTVRRTCRWRRRGGGSGSWNYAPADRLGWGIGKDRRCSLPGYRQCLPEGTNRRPLPQAAWAVPLPGGIGRPAASIAGPRVGRAS